MSKFETAFKAAIAENERLILISTLLAAPELTLGEIHKLSKGSLGRLFGEITIADLVSGGAGGEARPAKASAPAAEAAPAEGKARGAARPARGKAKPVNTRTAEGRAAYDEALFQAVKEHGGPVGAGALIAKVGGTSLQARAGLARLIEASRITWSGKARGTKYTAL